MYWLIRILRGLEIGFYFIFFAILLSGSTLLFSSAPGEAARRYTRPIEFDFVNWTLDAFGVKLGQSAISAPFYFDGPARHQLVVDYFHLMDTILQDENKLDLIYSDPSVKNPGAASASLRAELAGLYTRQSQLDPMAESILQEQVSATLAEQGLTSGGQPIPPVLFHLTPLPYNLIISPRNKIQEDASISLIPDLTVDQQVKLENQVDKGLDVSSLVVPVGGIGTYPTMIERTTALDWLSDTIAHEWTHNWLDSRPLGLNYDTSPALRTMNETTADIVGGEIGAALLKRYYPEVATQSAMQIQTANLSTSPARASFDFRAECTPRGFKWMPCWQRERSRKPRPIWISAARFSGTMAIRSASLTRPILPFTEPTRMSRAVRPVKIRLGRPFGLYAPRAVRWRLF